ncbi:RluA family pseudouridine synthase [Paenibacillus glycanilyticus]|uniref:RluA family pseudouridine synthase n=1 Tax=Paenibacillus glycanilyticus TaxID=126569 RepID=UPI00203B1AC6|nr:RluA family pseudouridine synthase [Paenibacillus glycanilyticus]MCM3630077.1 RluA family pseudouridine synthase [Paenibacillus glycanilyticus]
MQKRPYRRNGQWLELLPADLAEAPAKDTDSNQHTEQLTIPEAGSHPHLVRQWLLARSLFPAKWINRLFSVGGIKWEGELIRLLAFPPVDPAVDPLYRKVINNRHSVQEPKVLYEDDFCLVLNKPAGMPVHESYAGQTGTLDEAAARLQLGKDDPLPVRHIHRLDDDTSGPVLYAKNDLAQWVLDEAMREKRIDRRYLAVVSGRVKKPAGTVNAPIGKDRHHSTRRRVTPSGDAAVTHYETVRTFPNASLVRLQLETGRTHQIRVHMSHIGHPLVGDKLYGGDSRLLPHQALHGERLLFPHPWSGEMVEAASPQPDWLAALLDKLNERTN